MELCDVSYLVKLISFVIWLVLFDVLGIVVVVIVFGLNEELIWEINWCIVNEVFSMVVLLGILLDGFYKGESVM